MTRYFPCPFNIVVPANSARNLCSAILANATQLVEILLTFPTGTGLNLLYQFYLLGGRLGDPTLQPGGGEITVQEITPGYFAGDGVTYTVPFNRAIGPPTQVLCLYATNNTGLPFTAEAIAILAGPD